MDTNSIRTLLCLSDLKNDINIPLTMNEEEPDKSKQKCSRCKHFCNIESFINKHGKITKNCSKCRDYNKSLFKKNVKCEEIGLDVTKQCNSCKKEFINKAEERKYVICLKCREHSNKSYHKCKGQKPTKAYSTTNTMDYDIIEYDDNKYVVCQVQYCHGPILFIINYDDFPLIQNDNLDKVLEKYAIKNLAKNYTRQSQGYIGRQILLENDTNKQYVFVHDLIKDNIHFSGKGQKITVDHLNGCPRDNRRCNLEIKSQSKQNLNQSKRLRTGKYNLNFNQNFIPKNICYDQSRQDFHIEFRWHGENRTNKRQLLNEDKDQPLHIKCLFRMEILKKIKEILPEHVNFLPDHFLEGQASEQVFNAIIQKSKFPQEVKDNNLSHRYQIIEKTAEESKTINTTNNKAYYVLKGTEEDNKIVNKLIIKYPHLIELCLKKARTDFNLIEN